MPDRDKELARLIAEELSRMVSEKVGKMVLGKVFWLIIMLILIAALFTGLIHLPSNVTDRIEAVRAH